MEGYQYDNIQHKAEQTLFPDSLVSRVSDWERGSTLKEGIEDNAMEEVDDSPFDSMLCDPNSKLIPTGFSRSDCTDEMLMFVNAGGEAVEEVDSGKKIVGDTYFEGGNVLVTNEYIHEAGEYSCIYQSARLGNFCYRFNNFPEGDYFVDLHFAEIINTNGPKGMRVFNVYMQEEKVLSDFDIFSVVGANMPLKLIDLRVKVMSDGMILIRFEGINGSPMVCGICVRMASNVSVSHEYLKCNKCAAEIELSSAEKKLMRTKAKEKYEKRIQELALQCQAKTNECHEAWMSLTSTSEELENIRMELDNRTFETRSLDLTIGKQAEVLKDINNKYENAKKYWDATVKNLDEKIKVMKKEQSQLSKEAHQCVDSIPELNKMVFGVQALVSQCEELKYKYYEEQAKRKELYNQLQEIKGNIRVFCRCRPLSKKEISTGSPIAVNFDTAEDGELLIASTKKTFKFDRVYTPVDDQVDVFADALPLVTSVLDGYNVCIFAYGQTGTGKTFTMEGTEQNRGVNYRTLEQLFEIAKERRDTFKYNISVSVLEVYNEQIRDLLATSPSSKKLEIKQSLEGSHHVPGIVEANVDNIKEVWDVLQTGSNSRAVGSNNVNEHSSRSHCMLCIMVKATNLHTGECTKSKLWLVDLAGSERLGKTDVQGERLKEAQNINRSLSALGDVIYALASKNSHIPYRNSKLTHLLQDSLGGESKTLMFVQISPSVQDLSETLSSLNFATRVRGVELGPAKRQADTGELQKMKTTLDKLRQECRSKDELLKKLEENLQNLDSKAKGRDQSCKIQQEKIRELEGQLELKIALHSQLEKQVTQLSDRLHGRDDTCSQLQQKVKQLSDRLLGRDDTCSHLQQKIKELEDKLREKQQSESEIYQQVNALENKLKEQIEESESNSHFLQEKIKELELKLKEQEQSSEVQDQSSEVQDQSSEVLSLQQKIKELEAKLIEQKQQTHLAWDAIDPLKATPNKGKTCIRNDDSSSVNDVEPQVLRSLNARSTLPRRNNSSLHETTTRRKREYRSGETENNVAQSTYMKENKIRKSDPPKPAARTTRTMTTPAATTKSASTSSQVPLTHKRLSRDQVQSVRERESRKKIWS